MTQPNADNQCCCLACDPVSGEIGRECTKPNADKLKLREAISEVLHESILGHAPRDKSSCDSCLEYADRILHAINTRPAPCVGDDVVANLKIQRGLLYHSTAASTINNALSALTDGLAELLTLTKQDRVLPELPDGWRLQHLSDSPEGWHCVLLCKNGSQKDVRSNEYPKDRLPTAISAVLAAIAKVQK